MVKLLEGLASGSRWFKYGKFTASAAARAILYSRTGALAIPGFRSYPTRDVLDKLRDQGEFFGSAQEIYCVYVTARKLMIHKIQNTSHIKEVLLPDPRSASFKQIVKSNDEEWEQTSYVCKSSLYLRDTLRKPIYWYPEFAHISMMFGDPTKDGGWVHVEHALPYAHANLRPSLTYFRPKFQSVVDHYWRVYEGLKCESYEPDWDFVEQTVAGDT